MKFLITITEIFYLQLFPAVINFVIQKYLFQNRIRPYLNHLYKVQIMDHKEDNSDNLEMDEICRLLRESQFEEQSSGPATAKPLSKYSTTDESGSDDEPLFGLATAELGKYSSLDGNLYRNEKFLGSETAESSTENSPPDFAGLGIASHSSSDENDYNDGQFSDIRMVKTKRFPDENEHFPGLPGLSSSDETGSGDESFPDLETAKEIPLYNSQGMDQNEFKLPYYMLPTGNDSHDENSFGGTQKGSYVFKNKKKYPGCLGPFSGSQTGKYSSQDESELSDDKFSGLQSLKYSSSDGNQSSSADSVQNSSPDIESFFEAGLANKINNNILPKSDDYNDKKPQIIREDIEKSVLKYYDPLSKEIITSSRYVCLFFMGKSGAWMSKQCEGVFFLYETDERTKYRLMILNRLSNDHFFLTIDKNLYVGVKKPYILLRNTSDIMYSIWFHDEEDCRSVTDNLMNIVSELIAGSKTEQKNIADKGVGSSVQNQRCEMNENMMVAKQVGTLKEQTPNDLPSPSVLDFFAKAGASHSAKALASYPQPIALPSGEASMPRVKKPHYVGEIEKGISSDNLAMNSGFEQQILKLIHPEFDSVGK